MLGLHVFDGSVQDLVLVSAVLIRTGLPIYLPYMQQRVSSEKYVYHYWPFDVEYVSSRCNIGLQAPDRNTKHFQHNIYFTLKFASLTANRNTVVAGSCYVVGHEYQLSYLLPEKPGIPLNYGLGCIFCISFFVSRFLPWFSYCWKTWLLYFRQRP